jgi:hypothetical protein
VAFGLGAGTPRQASTMQLGYLFTDPETQTIANLRLARLEGLKEMRAHLFWNAAAIVCDRESDAISMAAETDAEISSRFCGLKGVVYQVRNELQQVTRKDRSEEPVGHLSSKMDPLFFQQRAMKANRSFYQRYQVRVLAGGLLPEEGEGLPADILNTT